MIHECSVCGEQSEWGRHWQWWGSIFIQEKWGLVVKTCSDSCREVLRCPQELLNRMAEERGLYPNKKGSDYTPFRKARNG